MTEIDIIRVFLAASIGTVALGLFSKWVDRKVTARLQWRVGPPLLQPLYDILKLMGKEVLVPIAARRTGFLVAPLVGLAAAVVGGTVVWVALLRIGHGFVGDLIVLFYLLTIPSIATVAGASASGNPQAALGAAREMKLILAYELPFILSLLVVVLTAGSTFSLNGIVQAQIDGAWTITRLSGVLAFLVAVVCMQAKLTLVPFDIPEAECEIQAGVFCEYSGPPLAAVHLTRAVMLAVMPLMLIVLFFGGVASTNLSWLWIALLYVGILVLTILIRNTNPRLRIDHAMRWFWFILTPVAIVALILAVKGW